MTKKEIKLYGDAAAKILFGRHDENLKLIKSELSVDIAARGDMLFLQGKREDVIIAERVIADILVMARAGDHLKHQEIAQAIKEIKSGDRDSLRDIRAERIEVMSKRQFVAAKSAGQKSYADAIRNSDITFVIGPAGTGKTYLAIAMAVSALKKQEVSRIILARPAVEAGESLGFLPGNISEKITPYLRPVYDALYDLIEADKVQQYIDKGIIEIAPLAYMRGRTLNDSFIILDEAQNSTAQQMKMFLTRLGFDSKIVITGDVTQVDLPQMRMSGLIQVQSILKDIPGINFIYLDESDVVRHNLVREIIRAYARFDAHRKTQ